MKPLSDYTRRKTLFILLLINTVVRLFLGAATNLGIDEAYYYSYALYPAWSYFDHPPFVGLFINLSTINLLINSELAVRLSSIITGTINILLIYNIGKLIKDEKTGLYAALLYTASFYTSIIVGTFILPDSPLSVFWLLAIYFFIRFLNNYEKAGKSSGYMLAFGFATGLALLSKYNAIFLWAGTMLFILFYKVKILKSASLYISILISVGLFLPVIIWNLSNNLESFSFHGDRVSTGLAINPGNFLTEVLGQFFYHNPFNVILIASALIYFLKSFRKGADQKFHFLLLVSFPLIITFLFLSLFAKTLPHWSGPGYYGLIIFTAYIFREKELAKPKLKYLKKILLGNIFFLLVVAVAYIQIQTGPAFPQKSTLIPEKLGKNDITLDMYGWDQLERKFNNLTNNDLENKAIEKDYVLITHNWFPACHIDYYTALPLGRKLYVYGTLKNMHNYYRLNQKRGIIRKGTDAYYITSSRYFKEPEVMLINKFETTVSPEIIELTRRGKPVCNVFVYRLISAKEDFSMNDFLKREGLNCN